MPSQTFSAAATSAQGSPIGSFSIGRLLLGGLAELLLLGLFAAQDGGVLQAGEHAQAGLAAVLDAEQVVLRPAGVLPACGRCRWTAITSQRNSLRSRVRKDLVAEELEVGHRVEPVGPAGMAGDEDQLAVARALGTPLQVVLDLGRLAVLVDAEEADVEVVAGILEVVRVAAEEGDVLSPGRRPAGRRCTS